MESPGLHLTPKPVAICACGEPIEMEMEHDKGQCVECQRVKVPDVLKREIDNYPGLQHYSVMLGYVLGTLRTMAKWRESSPEAIQRLVDEIDATRDYWTEQREKKAIEQVFGKAAGL